MSKCYPREVFNIREDITRENMRRYDAEQDARKTVIVHITKQAHGKYNYLANWEDPNTGYGFHDRFSTLAELVDYFRSIGLPRYIKTNF